MFQRCGLQYYYRYILNWSERPSLALANGKAGHSAVEFVLQTKIDTQELPPIDNVLDKFRDEYVAETAKLDASDLGPDENINQTENRTRSTLTYYHAVEAPLVTPLSVEQEFSLSIPGDEEYEQDLPPIVGRIDLVSARDNLTELLDHKFVGRAKRQEDIDLSDQLTLYDMTMARAGLPTDRLGFELFIPPNKTQGPRVIQMFRDPAMMAEEVRKQRHARLIYKMRTIERAIQSGIFIPTDNPMICGYCGFRDICQHSKADRWTTLHSRQTGAAS